MKALKKTFKLLIPLTFITLLSACNTDSKVFSNEYVGEWKSTDCEEGIDGHSFKQNWTIFDKDVGSLKNVINIWKQPNCPVAVSPKTIKVKSTLIIIKDSLVQVSATCKDGKASPSRLRFVSYVDETLTIVANTSTEQDAIRDTLSSQNIGNVLPEYNLFCLDNTGRLHTGDLTTGNGLTIENRPTDVDSVKSFSVSN